MDLIRTNGSEPISIPDNADTLSPTPRTHTGGTGDERQDTTGGR